MDTTTQARPRQRRFDVREYYAMARAGILAPDERIELIEGRIIAMSPIGIRHGECVRRLTRRFYRSVDPHAVISVQSPVRLDKRSEPEPDVALLMPKDYSQRHPRPADVLLLVEVSETTLAFDRNVKVPLYAKAGIREVWVMALEEERVYVYRRPEGKAYAEASVHERGGSLTVEALPAVGPFRVDDVLVP